MNDLPPRLHQRFEVTRTFAAENGASVHAVVERDTGKTFTLRVFTIRDARRAEACGDEFELLRGLHHPHLTTVFEFGTVDDVGFLLREYVEGGTLAEETASRDPATRRRLFGEIVSGLAALHARGIQHGDLKPDNVLLRREGTTEHAVLTDFGLATRLGVGRRAAYGTPPYIAPEILLGLPSDARSDLFSLAVTWLVGAAGCPPIDERKLYERFPRTDFLTALGLDVDALDPDLAPLLRAMLASAPAERPRSAVDLLERLGAVSSLEPREYARVLRPPPAFFAGDGRPVGDEIALAERVLTAEGGARSLLLLAASEADAQEAETWLRFHAARLQRPATDPLELRARFMETRRDADPSTSSATRKGHDAAIARAIAESASDHTILLDPELTGQRRGAIANAMALALRAAPGSRARLIAIGNASRLDTATALGFDEVVKLPALTAEGLAKHFARCERAESAEPIDRLRKLGERLLELAGPDSDAIESWLQTGLENGSIVATATRFDLSRFEPKGSLPGLEKRLEPLSIPARTVLAAMGLLGGFASREELARLESQDLSESIAQLRKLGCLVGDGEVFCALPPLLAILACDHLDRALAKRIASKLSSEPTLERPPSVRALLLGFAERGDEAIALLRESRPTEAAAASNLGRLVAILPERSVARASASLALSRVLADEGRLADAITALETTTAEGCVDVLTECAVRIRLGHLLHASARSDAALPHLEYAKARLREQRGNAPEALRREVERGLALVRAAQGDVGGAVRQLQLVLRGTGDEPDAAERDLAVLLGALALRDGKFAAARRTLESTLTAARKCGDEVVAAAAATNLSTLEQREGSLDRAVELLEEALAIRARRGDLYEEAIVRNNLGLALRERGDLDAAARQLEESRALRLRMGDERGAATVALNLAGVLALMGDLDAAARFAVTATKSLRALGMAGDEPEAFIAAARLIELSRVCGGDVEIAEQLEALGTPPPTGVASLPAAVRRAWGERRLAESTRMDDAQQGLHLAREAAVAFEQAGDRIGLARAAIEVASRQIQLTDFDGARVELARARRLAPARLDAELHKVGAILAAARGAEQEANTELARARESAGRCGLAVVHGEVLLREIALAAGNDVAREDARKLELRALLPLLKLPGARHLDPLDVLRRIYGKLVAPDFRVETTEPSSSVSTVDDRVLTAGIPEEVFRTFVMINRSVLREKDVDRLLERLLEHAVALSGARRGFVVLLHEGRVVCEARSGELEPENEEISRGIVMEAIQQMRPLVTANAKADSRLTGRKSIERFDLRSVLCVPFKCFSGTEGAIYVDNPVREGVFGGRAVDFLEALASQAAIAIGNIERNREIERLNEELKKRVAFREAELDQARRELVKIGVADGARRMIVQAESMRQVVDVARRVAKSDLPVLVLGESGTGKEMMARFVHEASARCAQPFVAENCSAIPETLLESEFFGCVKGAFTGADQDRDGLLSQANGGTLFLDEIGDMPLSLQAKLLRAIQEKAVRRVGASTLTPIDVRLVCATHRDVEAMVAEGKFREDLYYRIRGVVLRIPPLRERRDDIPALADAALERLNARYASSKRCSKALLKKLMLHDWPGNVRELESEITRLYHLAATEEIDDASFDLRKRGEISDTDSSVVAVRPMDQIEKDAIRLALRETGGNREEAARRLQISRAAFYVKLKAYGLSESSPSTRRKKS